MAKRVNGTDRKKLLQIPDIKQEKDRGNGECLRLLERCGTPLDRDLSSHYSARKHLRDTGNLPSLSVRGFPFLPHDENSV